ncbi:MAG: DUF1501 domain-containing protein [Acidobacteria bacterium]|nr:DUF1501 domain-containing protein [Acidobacteriota bacterium]MBV9478465.1 DUF1501 domain-containing protein [Acidobacteriota bacterium]
MNRRFFLKSTGLVLAGSALTPNVFAKMANVSSTRGKRVLVAIFQRGAVDGLNMIVPHGERAYYAARPSIAIPKANVLDLDGFFGAHPSLQSLMPFWRDKSLGIVHAAGSPDATRSHFDAQDFMESGTPGVKSTEDGFLSRALMTEARAKSPLRAVAISPSMPRILSGSAGAIATTSLADFAVRSGKSSADAAASFESMYGEAVAGALGDTAKDSFEAARLLQSVDTAASKDGYPRNPLADALQQIATLIKSNVGLEIAFADVGGWDTHAAEGGAQGQLANNLRGFSDAIAAFANDLGSRMADVTLVTMSEFGRTVHENGNRGTDHGHATVMLALGGGVNGGKVHGHWPGLETSQLYEQRDLAVTTDFRDVFAELLTKRQGVTSLASVFPRHQPRAVGLVA